MKSGQRHDFIKLEFNSIITYTMHNSRGYREEILLLILALTVRVGHPARLREYFKIFIFEQHII